MLAVLCIEGEKGALQDSLFGLRLRPAALRATARDWSYSSLMLIRHPCTIVAEMQR